MIFRSYNFYDRSEQRSSFFIHYDPSNTSTSAGKRPNIVIFVENLKLILAQEGFH